MKRILILIGFTVLSACGSSSNPNKVAAVKVGDELYKPDNAAAMAIDNDRDERIVCERRIVTGSHRKEKVCTTVTERNRERQAARERISNNDTTATRRLTQLKEGDR